MIKGLPLTYDELDNNFTYLLNKFNNDFNSLNEKYNQLIIDIENSSFVGATGPQGENGLNGLDGKDGINGLNGIDGLDGKDGINGLNGLDGKDGINGLNGEKGDKGDKGEPATISNTLIEKIINQIKNELCLSYKPIQRHENLYGHILPALTFTAHYRKHKVEPPILRVIEMPQTKSESIVITNNIHRNSEEQSKKIVERRLKEKPWTKKYSYELHKAEPPTLIIRNQC
jgi:hypothetical protein